MTFRPCPCIGSHINKVENPHNGPMAVLVLKGYLLLFQRITGLKIKYKKLIWELIHRETQNLGHIKL